MNHPGFDSKNTFHPNHLIFVFFLALSGLIFIIISSTIEANTIYQDPNYFTKKHLIWLSLSIAVFILFSKINLMVLKKIIPVAYFLNLILLLATIIPQIGHQALGARRWLELGPLNLQPSELLKLTSVIYFSHLYSQKNNINFYSLFFHLTIPFILIVFQPNLSTAILISLIVISLFYLAGGSIISLFALSIFMGLSCLALVIYSPYRLSRFDSLISNPDQQSYHQRQIIISISSGGLTGKGFANSDQKYKFLPKISTDSILAVIGEETGLIGIFLILFCYIQIFIRLLKFSSLISNQFLSLLVAGVAVWIGAQSLINVFATLALIPLTGVPLPLVSFGGSALISLMAGLGLVENIQQNQAKLLYSKKHDQTKNHTANWHSPHPRR